LNNSYICGGFSAEKEHNFFKDISIAQHTKSERVSLEIYEKA
jgi:hypothetical protein